MMDKPKSKDKFVPELVGQLKEGDKDWGTPCILCGDTPTVHPTKLCGPHCFGESDAAGGNW